MGIDKTWRVEMKSYSAGKFLRGTITEGMNQFCDGPEREIGVIYNEEDAEEICRLHNESIKENA